MAKRKVQQDNDLQNTTQKTKDRATRTILKIMNELRWSLVFCVAFCGSLFVLLYLSFAHCIVVPSSIYDLVGFVLLDL
jgi:hypothetical protein